MINRSMGIRSAIAIAALTLVLAAGSARAQTQVTYYKDVLPILQESCQACHQPQGPNFSGMVAPMSFMSFDEVRPWAKSIAKQVSSRSMPPWFASPEHDGEFVMQRTLTDKQIQTIERWVATGARRGNEANAPAPVDLGSRDGWSLGEPDLIIKMPEPYWVADDVVDIQPSFTITLTEEQLPEDRWIQWTEFRPGSEIVHHAGASVIPVDENGELINDPISGGKIIGTAPGDGPDIWPVGYGKLMRKGTQVRFGMHYHKEDGPGTGMWDQSSLAIKFHTEPVKYVVRATAINSFGWEIPPHHADWQVGASRVFEEDTMIINMMPHMHFRGKAAKYEAFYPDGTSETLLDVPEYNYNWQLTYTYKEPKLVPAGTRLVVTMVFDNSEGNEYVPDPDRPIAWGGMTQDEMNNGWLEFANAEPIDDITKVKFQDLGDRFDDPELFD